MTGILKRFKDPGDVFRQPDQGGKRATTGSQGRYLASIAKRNRILTSVHSAREIVAPSGGGEVCPFIAIIMVGETRTRAEISLLMRSVFLETVISDGLRSGESETNAI
ncbi:hypothetical protein AVEN_254549-1 [Araneus ventricosus]|uniref:Uncharacterized protein n=1 Tax=Araneus ventricosus TaxID=182803 RepID=A0A4Y2AT92_ARAVE|nr:hypothetical protein AVEN_254549-1 [Araneus ventricosus]